MANGLTANELKRWQYFQSLSPEQLAALPLGDRMEYVSLRERAAGVHYTQTGKERTVAPELETAVSPGQPTFPAMPTARPPTTPTPAPTAPTLKPWPEMPTTPETPFEIPEQWMPQMTTAEPMTLNQLMDFVINMMKERTEPYEDPKTGKITYQPVYTNEDITRVIDQIRESVSLTGFGPHTPYYGAAQQYYAQIAQTGAAGGGGQLTPIEYLDYQLAQQQLALQQQLAMLPYQDMTAAERARIEQQIADRLAQLDLAQQQLKLQEQEMWLPYQQVPAGQEEQLALERELAMLPYQQMTVAQQAALDLERQRYGAELAAQPKSWLEYAAYTGEQPAIQPWMQPLMPQQYQQLGAGQAIPGYQGTQGMTGMPQLTTPSRQYQARMGPTAQEQYYGYQQAQSGARPEETEFRLWSGAPPSGQYGGLRYTR